MLIKKNIINNIIIEKTYFSFHIPFIHLCIYLLAIHLLLQSPKIVTIKTCILVMFGKHKKNIIFIPSIDYSLCISITLFYKIILTGTSCRVSFHGSFYFSECCHIKHTHKCVLHYSEIYKKGIYLYEPAHCYPHAYRHTIPTRLC